MSRSQNLPTWPNSHPSYGHDTGAGLTTSSSLHELKETSKYNRVARSFTKMLESLTTRFLSGEKTRPRYSTRRRQRPTLSKTMNDGFTATYEAHAELVTTPICPSSLPACTKPSQFQHSQQLPSSDASTLENLPEIHMLVAEHLSKTSSICLGLTCRTLYGLHWDIKKKVSMQSMTEDPNRRFLY
jgi:hypothetical protein